MELWKVVAVLVTLLLLILLVWSCQYLCIKLFKKYQRVKCRHLEDEDYSLTQSLLQKESCALKVPTLSTSNNQTQSMNDTYYKDRILPKPTSEEKQHSLNFAKSRNQLCTDLSKSTKRYESLATKINLSTEENQRLYTFDANKYSTSPSRLKAKSDIILFQTKKLYIKEGSKTKSFSDSDMKVMKTSQAALVMLKEIKYLVTQYIYNCNIHKSKEEIKPKLTEQPDETTNGINNKCMHHQRMTEMYDDLGMLFSMYMKQQSRLCQRKYCLLSRHLQKRKNHDETKCQMRPKPYQHNYTQPKCNSGSVCCDTYDEYKLMFVSPSEQKSLYKNIYSRRNRFLNQPCLSPHLQIISKDVE